MSLVVEECSREMVDISVVTPVYGCCDCLVELHRRLVAVLEPLVESFEIVMVNDASPDGSWAKIVELSKLDSRVKGVNLSRNFGQHYAISAGLDHTFGRYAVVMDCDLQDQPEEITKLYAKIQEGHDIVFGRRVDRQDGFFKKLSSKMFWFVYSYLTDTKLNSSTANFSIITRQVVQNLCRFKERNRSYPLFLDWLGFDVDYVDVEHSARYAGETSYSLRKLIHFAVESITSQSNKPLVLSIQFGFSMSFLSFIYAFYLFMRYMLYGVPVSGWTSLMVSIYFLAGLGFSNIGMIGLYLGKVFDETKNRPLYVVKERLNLPEETDSMQA